MAQYKKLGTTKKDSIREIESWMGSEGNPQIAEIIFNRLYDSDIIESNELGYFITEPKSESWFSDLWEEVDNSTEF